MQIVSTNFIPDRSRPGLTTTAISAVDLQGAGGNWATVGRRSRGGRRVRRQREKRKGKGRELADMMERRKVDILCVQETRWKGSKARSIGAGFKLFYYGVDSKRNGVGVVLKEEFVRNVLEIGCELKEKERFWSELDEVMEGIPTGDEEVMGKYGVKERNLEGQMVVDFAKRMDMAVVNTYFQKREEHRVTYKSGGRRTQKLRQALGGQVVLPDDWETTAEVIRETGRKDSIQRKRLAKKKWDMDRTEENRQEYKELQRRVKREVSKAKQKAYDELYTRLDTREGEKDLYRVLTSEESVQRRWKEYFEELMNEENEREKRVEGVNSVEQNIDKIRKDEVRKTLKRMKSGKAVGPDDIPVEVWKCLGEAAVEFLTSLFNTALENLEKAYDRVPREELWYCMRKSGVAEKYVRVVQDMYERSRTVVKCAVVMDQLSEEVRQETPWTMMFADDIVICSESREQVEESLERWRFALERRGMKVSRSKTEYMCVNEREGSGTVRLQGEEVKKVQELKYLGSTVQSNGECGKEVKKRVQAGWNGWRKVSGVLCDRNISVRIKGKVYRTVVRAAMLYGLETVSLRKRQESELEVAELKMLRFSLGVTRLDRIRNEYIRGTAHVGRLGDKVREARLRWFGHVQRRESPRDWQHPVVLVVSFVEPRVPVEIGLLLVEEVEEGGECADRERRGKEKERFWSELDEVMESIPTGERVVIGADFNGHVGEGNTGDEEVMGKFGVKERNLEGQMVVDFAKRMDMAVVNTYFQKREEHRVTYKSGGRRTQVDYILCRRGNLKEISDCKVVVGESVARQHRMVVCRMTLMVCKKKRSEIEKKTKWWKLKKEECCEEFRQKLRQALGGQVVLPDDWETTAEVIRETGRKVLGVSSGRRKEDKETWWWNEEVQDSIQRKRLAKKKWDMDRTEENRQEYKELQRRVKREVSKAKQKAYDELYTRLDTREGEKDLYRLAR
ncbi:hypothetical protein QTP86_006792 [Hemibagrus guttatus]|nr:hypothetical protein QTP86_006792 [Hemibagrus guttatus]